jgi:hypothetical protein
MTFNPSIPTGGQTISSTTVPIQTNFSVSNTAFGIDHTAFSVNLNQGQHQKVSLVQQATDPTALATAPILYAKSTTSNTLNNDIYFERSSNDGSNIVQLTTTKFNPVASSNGGSFLPGGIVMQWGSQTFTGSQSPTVTFPTAFPNACFQVQLSLLNAGGTQTQNRITTISTTGFTASVNASGACTWYWLAIGN